jgi:hypothetical protein
MYEYSTGRQSAQAENTTFVRFFYSLFSAPAGFSFGKRFPEYQAKYTKSHKKSRVPMRTRLLSF